MAQKPLTLQFTHQGDVVLIVYDAPCGDRLIQAGAVTGDRVMV